MKINVINRVKIDVILIFTIAIFVSLIPENFKEFFGDVYCTNIKDFHYGTNSWYEPHYHWGYRHWLFFLMGFTLFVIQIIDIIIKVNKDN